MVDIDCSEQFQTFGINIAKTLTRTRGMQGGPWVSTRGRRVTTEELLRLQGFQPEEVHWQQAGVSKTHIGGMVGNSVSVHAVGHLLASDMFAAGLSRQRLEFKGPGHADSDSDADATDTTNDEACKDNCFVFPKNK